MYGYLIAAQVYDAVITYIGLTRGVAVEGNPLALYFFDTFGLFWSLVAVKTLIIGFIMIMASKFPVSDKITPRYIALMGIVTAFTITMLANTAIALGG